MTTSRPCEDGSPPTGTPSRPLTSCSDTLQAETLVNYRPQAWQGVFEYSLATVRRHEEQTTSSYPVLTFHCPLPEDEAQLDQLATFIKYCSSTAFSEGTETDAVSERGFEPESQLEQRIADDFRTFTLSQHGDRLRDSRLIRRLQVSDHTGIPGLDTGVPGLDTPLDAVFAVDLAQRVERAPDIWLRAVNPRPSTLGRLRSMLVSLRGRKEVNQVRSTLQ